MKRTRKNIFRKPVFSGTFLAVCAITLLTGTAMPNDAVPVPKTVTIKQDHYFLTRPGGLGNSSEMTYIPANVDSNGAAFTLKYVDEGGRGMDGYPNGGAGGHKVGGSWIPGDYNLTGMPVRISSLNNSLRIEWKTSQQNATDDDDKWQATINVIFDGGTSHSEPVTADRDYDLVIFSDSHNFAGASLDDKPKDGNKSYWWFARYPDGALRPFVISIGGIDYEYAVRYKFFQESGDKDNKVQIKYIPVDSIPPSINVALKPFIDNSKDFIQYAGMPDAERARAHEKVANPDLWLKSIRAGYECYKGASILRNDYFRVSRSGTTTSPAAPAAEKSHAVTMSPNEYYRLESREDGWCAFKSSTQIKLKELKHFDTQRFRFTHIGGGYCTISLEATDDVITVTDGSTSDGVAVSIAPYTGADYQQWQIIDVGDGFCKIVAKHSDKVLGHSFDTTPNPVTNDGICRQYNATPLTPNKQWKIVPSHPDPYECIGVSQSGYHPNQHKLIVLTKLTKITAPSYSVTGPESTYGTMIYWGSSTYGTITPVTLYLYQADVSSLTAVGNYTFSVDGVSVEFEIATDVFSNLRAEFGGTLTWSDIINGFFKTQTVSPPGDILVKVTEAGKGVFEKVDGTYTLTNGWYDATSRDSKIARTCVAAKFMLIGMMENRNPQYRKALIPSAKMIVGHLADTQNTDGSWPLGKVRRERRDYPYPNDYAWCIDVDTGGSAHSVTVVAMLYQALMEIDNTYAAKALTAALKGWDYVIAHNNSAGFTDPKNNSFKGNSSNILNASIELYLATGKNEFKEFADARINEGSYATGAFIKADGEWPGQTTTVQADFEISQPILHMCRYYPVASAAIKAKIETHVRDWLDKWQSLINTGWGVPANGGAPNVAGGWCRKLVLQSALLMHVAYTFGWKDARDNATDCWSYITGTNAIASQFVWGARGTSLHKRFKFSWDSSKGAIIPGLGGVRKDGNALTLRGGSKSGESVTFKTSPLFIILALGDKLFEDDSGSPPNESRRHTDQSRLEK